MKVTVHDILVDCPKHGKVPYTATSDPKGDVVIVYCPRCEEGSTPAAPAPEHHHIQFRAHHHRLSRCAIAATEDSRQRPAVGFQIWKKASLINEGNNLMTKERISSDVDRKLRMETDAKAEELGISRAKLIEIALKSELGHFNVHKENKRLTGERNRFKAQAEEAQSNYETCSTKLTLLLTRNWWERLWNVLPWVNERLWDTPSRPITPTPDTEISLPTDKTIE